MFCEDCQPGHYSLSGGIVFDNFKSFPDSLPDDFHIKTEYRGHENIAAGICSGEFVFCHLSAIRYKLLFFLDSFYE